MAKTIKIGPVDGVTRKCYKHTKTKLGFDGGVENEDTWTIFCWNKKGRLEVDSSNNSQLCPRHVRKLIRWLQTL